jgi:hypothetical protein
VTGLGDKWPRQYAAEIMAVRDKEKRKEMFKQVPDHIRDIVWDHCVNATRRGR